jgi:hypothetical protein
MVVTERIFASLSPPESQLEQVIVAYGERAIFNLGHCRLGKTGGLPKFLQCFTFSFPQVPHSLSELGASVVGSRGHIGSSDKAVKGA